MVLFRLQSVAISLGLLAGASLALAQVPPAVRPTPPTRDPHTPGYVSAVELTDGSNPPANADGPDRALFIVLDNLIAERRVPVMIAISLSSFHA